jgi:hypothetical protein
MLRYRPTKHPTPTAQFPSTFAGPGAAGQIDISFEAMTDEEESHQEIITVTCHFVRGGVPDSKDWQSREITLAPNRWRKIVASFYTPKPWTEIIWSVRMGQVDGHVWGIRPLGSVWLKDEPKIRYVKLPTILGPRPSPTILSDMLRKTWRPDALAGLMCSRDFIIGIDMAHGGIGCIYHIPSKRNIAATRLGTDKDPAPTTLTTGVIPVAATKFDGAGQGVRPAWSALKMGENAAGNDLQPMCTMFHDPILNDPFSADLSLLLTGKRLAWQIRWNLHSLGFRAINAWLALNPDLYKEVQALADGPRYIQHNRSWVHTAGLSGVLSEGKTIHKDNCDGLLVEKDVALQQLIGERDFLYWGLVDVKMGLEFRGPQSPWDVQAVMTDSGDHDDLNILGQIGDVPGIYSDFNLDPDWYSFNGFLEILE